MAPLFESGALYFRHSAPQQALQATDAGYRQAMLAPSEQMVDVLRALEHDIMQLGIQLRAQATASAALDEINADYRVGVAGCLQVSSTDQ